MHIGQILKDREPWPWLALRWSLTQCCHL